MAKEFVFLFAASLIAACNSTVVGTGGVNTTSTTGGSTSTAGGVSTSTTATTLTGGLSINGIQGATFAGNSLTSVTIGNNIRPTLTSGGLAAGLFSDGTSSLYRLQVANDGQSFAVAGHTLGGVYAGATFVGGYTEAASSAPTSGSASYSGTYAGDLPDGFSTVSGSANVNIDFDNSQFDASITNRIIGGLFPSIYFNTSKLTPDVAFSGTVTNGILSGAHSDADSSGSLDGQAYANGVVGVINVHHSGAGVIVSNPLETGVFAAD